jgi:gliding motility-associated-like protein
VPGTYLLFVIDTFSGCQAVDSHVVVDLILFPPAVAGEDQTLDCEVGFIEFIANPGVSPEHLVFSWSGPPGGIVTDSNSREIIAITPGAYILTVVDTTNGCMSTDTVSVFDFREIPEAEAGPPQTLDCLNDAVLLDAGQSTTGPDIVHIWNGPGIHDAHALSIEVALPGWYHLVVMNIANGCMSNDSTLVTMEDLLSGAAVSTIDPICYGDTTGEILVTEIVGGVFPYFYSLDGIIFQESNTFSGLSPGNYTVVIRDSIGCEWETTVTINEGLLLSLDLGLDLSLEVGDSVQLYADYLPLIELDSIIWNPDDLLSCMDCLDPYLTVPLPDTFMISATIFSDGCAATDSILIRAEDDYTLWVPNVFSPNDDGVNDYITVYSNDVLATVLVFEIFDRWGEKVFRNTYFPVNKPILGWDGIFRDRPMNPAVFVYVAHVRFRNGSERIVSGDITLVR